MTEQYQQASINLLPAAAVFSGGLGPADVSIPGAVVTSMPIQVVEEESSLIRHVPGSSEIEFLADGIAVVSWDVSINVASGGRKNSQASLFLDVGDGMGFMPVNLTFGYGYHRNTAQGRDSFSGTHRLLNVRRGHKIEIAGQRISGTGNLEFIASSCSIIVGLLPEQ